jgi:hypothetical protein
MADLALVRPTIIGSQRIVLDSGRLSALCGAGSELLAGIPHEPARLLGEVDLYNVLRAGLASMPQGKPYSAARTSSTAAPRLFMTSAAGSRSTR